MSANAKTLVCQDALLPELFIMHLVNLKEVLFSSCYEYQKLPILSTNHHLFCCLVEWRHCPDEGLL